MPFGLVFGAVVFAVLCLWRGVVAILQGATLPARVSGVVLIVLGVSLSLGLLKRQNVARWTGVVAAALMALRGGLRMMDTGAVLDHVVFLGALMVFVLLVLPATGDVHRGLPAAERRPRGRGLGMVAAVALTCLFGVSVWAFVSRDPNALNFNLPRVEWQEYAPGLERAKLEGKPVLIDFYADWCAPCKTMDRRTFRNPAVVEKVSVDLVAVRVDSEETEPRNGVSGTELAELYGVLGYPTLMILDGDGRILARKQGLQGPGQLLGWIDEILADPNLEPQDPTAGEFSL